MTLFGSYLARLSLALLAIGPLEALAATYHVAVLDDEFSPKNLTIAPGDTVIWTNVGGSAHTVTADDGLFDSSADGSASMPAGSTFSHTFLEARRYPYYCQLHGGPGGQDMAGVIRVADPGTNTPPAIPSNATPAAGSINVSLAPTLSASAFVDADEGDVHQASQWILRNIGTGETALDTGATTTNRTSISLADLGYATTYGWKVRYSDDRGAWSDYSTETQFTTVAAPTSAGAGLTATYGSYDFKTDRFSARTTGVDPEVNFDWKLRKPKSSIPANHFSVRWEGKVLPEFSERYRFRVRADGGVRLWVNDVLLIDDWVTTRFAVFRNNVVTLQAGVPVTIKLEYFDTAGNASVALRWSSPSLEPEVVPQARLFPLNP